MNKFKLLAVGATASLLLAAGPVSAGNGSTSHGSGSSLQGAWEIEVIVRFPADDCTKADPVPFGPNPFPSFSTFHEGGTMNEHGSRSSPANRSPGFGVWERLGNRRYGYHLMFHSFGADGLLAATMDISTRLVLARDGDTFEGVSRFVFTSVDGTAQNFCATMTGERFTL